VNAMSDNIGSVEIYRGVEIHDAQSAERIDAVVKPEIDAVLGVKDVATLVRWCSDITRSPESRLLAARVLRTMQDLAVAGRAARPAIDLEYVTAAIAGLDSRSARSPTGYGTVSDTPSPPGLAGHAPRPVEYQREVEEDRRRAAHGVSV